MCEAEAAQDIPRLTLVQTLAEELVAPGEHPVAARPPVTYRTLLTLLAKRIHNKILLIQRRRIRGLFGMRAIIPDNNGYDP
jgi:hypothetical protein